MLLRQHAYGGAPGQKVFHHLPGHVLREGGDAPFDQAMVPCKHHHLRLLQHRPCALANHADFQCQMLQRTQRAERFGFLVDGALQCGAQFGILEVQHRIQIQTHGDISPSQ